MQTANSCVFPAGSFIEIDNPVTGKRYVGQVAATGSEFFDAPMDDAPRFPIMPEMNPVVIGDFRDLKDLMMDNAPEDLPEFSNFIDTLTEQIKPFNQLVFMRAVKWAFDSRQYDTQAALKAAEAEADDVATLHAMMASKVAALQAALV